MEGARESALDVPAGHPAFEGHFPGRPILPGVVLLAEMMALVRAEATGMAREWRLESAKFASPVAPGTRLTLLRRDEARGRVRFEIRAGERLVASGVLARLSVFAAT
jgi:3-hydroxymyristoyl/3-hydroxydecanoyl-(acyl carrier protein) dehydratase